MSGKAPRRKPTAINPNDNILDELMTSPVMKGFVSFLNVRPHEATVGEESRPTVGPELVVPVKPVASEQVASPPTVGPDIAPTVGTESGPTLVLSAPAGIEPPAVGRESPPTVGLESPTVGPDSPPTVQVTTTTTLKLAPLETAQDGHSDLENRVYETLWDHAEPEQIHQGNRCRELTIGYGELSEAARTDRQNAKRAIQALIDKLAVEMIAPGNACTRTGARYRVYSYRAIIARRRASGYTNTIRNRGGVTLWPPQSRPTVGGEIGPTVGLEGGTVGSVSTGTVGSVSTGAVGTEPPRIIIESKRSLAEENPAPPPLAECVVSAVVAVAGVAAERDIHALVDACRRVRPDVRPKEIAHFIGMQRDAQGINSWPKFLLAKVPPYLEGKAFEMYRSREDEAIRQRFEYERTQLAARLEEARRWLAEAGSDDFLREHAAATLRDYDATLARLEAEERLALYGE